MKVAVLYPTQIGPWGGGNQFIKAIQKKFKEAGMLTDIASADIVLFNSFDCIEEVVKIKKTYPKKIFVHRIDGPMKLYNNDKDLRDLLVYHACNELADGVIFQSEWSKKENLKNGLPLSPQNTVITNAPDPEIFFTLDKTKDDSKKIRIISTSWSNNPKKGFAEYLWLDQNLDFNQYDYYFAGRSAVDFKNIINLGKLDSHALANELRKSDVYITCSQKDPCSNSLLEAQACGLVTLALNDGGHPELVKNHEFLFNHASEIPTKLALIKKELSRLKNENTKPSLDETFKKYVIFLNTVKSKNKKVNLPLFKLKNWWIHFKIKLANKL